MGRDEPTEHSVVINDGYMSLPKSIDCTMSSEP